MSRTLTGAVTTETAQSDVRAGVLVELQFGSGTINVWDGVKSLAWDSKTWTGAGDLGEITPISEKPGMVATGVTLTLSGVDSALLATALAEDYQGLPCGIWVAFFDDDWAIIADPVKVFAGIIDNMTVADMGATGTITVRCESWLRVLERSSERRYTDLDQQGYFAADRGFEFTAGQMDDGLYWGRSGPTQTKATRKSLKKKEKAQRKAAKKARKRGL